MEGLIPLVYKTIRRNRTRRQYESLSSGAAQTYNNADFYINDIGNQYVNMPPSERSGELYADRNGHRRHKSFHVDYSGALSMEDPARKKELVRFRSHRMLSCMTVA